MGSTDASFERIRPRHAKMRQFARPAVPYQAAMVENLLELSGSFFAAAGSEIGLPADVCRVEARNIGGEIDLAKLDRAEECLQIVYGPIQPAPQPRNPAPKRAPKSPGIAS